MRKLALILISIVFVLISCTDFNDDTNDSSGIPFSDIRFNGKFSYSYDYIASDGINETYERTSITFDGTTKALWYTCWWDYNKGQFGGWRWTGKYKGDSYSWKINFETNDGMYRISDWGYNNHTEWKPYYFNDDGTILYLSDYQYTTYTKHNVALEKQMDGPYTVKYDLNNGTGTVPIDNNIYNNGDTVILKNRGDIHRTGYDFMGWGLFPDYNILYYYSDTSSATIKGHSITFFARWRERREVIFITNGGTEIPSRDITNMISGIINKPTDPKKDGYNFGGWYVDEALNVPFDFTKSYTITGSIILYAKWNEYYSYEISNFSYYRNNSTHILTLYWSNPIDINFSHVQIYFLDSGWSLPHYTGNNIQFAMEDFFNYKSVLIKAVDINGNASLGLRYNL